MPQLIELRKHGQSFWLDGLTRLMLENGELERRIHKQGLSGIASNSAIFYKAVSSSTAYDDAIQSKASMQRSIDFIYQDLVVADVQQACDLLSPVYQRSDANDGYVSLGVSPHLAHDADATLRQARHLWDRVGRPNLLVKMPGTRECMPVIEELLYLGINVNVTLLFSLETYWETFQNYMQALERRLEDGMTLKPVYAVANFFLSPVDEAVESVLRQRVSEKINSRHQAEQLLGQVAIANARFAYASFRALIASERWHRLEKHGAMPQRIVWSSTTSHSQSSELKYIESLIGPYTISLMQNVTADAFDDYGHVSASVQQQRKAARSTMDNLKKLGIDLDTLNSQIMDECIKESIGSHDKAISLVTERAATMCDTDSVIGGYSRHFKS